MEKDNLMQVTDRVGDLTKHKRMLGKPTDARDQNRNTKLTLHSSRRTRNKDTEQQNLSGINYKTLYSIHEEEKVPNKLRI